MRVDYIALLGGLALGATGAALFEVARSKRLLGWSGGSPGGGPGGGGFSYAPGNSGVYAGPPGAFGGGFMGPEVVGEGPSEGGDGTGPIVSVPPIIHDGNGAFGGSFFGVNVAPWFWPLNVLPVFQLPVMPRDEEIICKKIEGDEETLVCKRRYPVQPVAWGPPAGWL